MGSHAYCRTLLKLVMEDVKKNVAPEIIREAWALRYRGVSRLSGRQMAALQIPSVDFYWYGQGCCTWYAKVKGWTEYLAKLGVEGYTLDELEERAQVDADREDAGMESVEDEERRVMG